MVKTKKIVYLAGAALMLVAGCAVGPDFSRPAAPNGDTYTREALPGTLTAADGQVQQFSYTNKIQAEWWKMFNSADLDRLIQEAMANNPSLQAARSRLEQSGDEMRAGYGVFYPQLDANASFARQKITPIRLGSTAPGSIFNLYTLGGAISYALDIFGGQRRAVEGLRAQVDYEQFTTQGAYLALTGNIIGTVIARAAYSEEIAATEEIVNLMREQVKIAQVQADAGTAPYTDVLSLQSQLAASEATLPGLRQKLSQSEHLLATLLGKTPAELNPPSIGFQNLTLPRDLPLSLPSELVRQRPDILAAEAQLHVASANIGVATAALFPSFTLTGGFGVNNTSTDTLFNSNSKFWSLGAVADLPLFHGGTQWYQRKAAVEVYNEASAEFRQTVLDAFAQVADVLDALQNDAESVKAQELSVAAAEQAAHLITVNYQAGTASYLQTIVANTQYHQSRIAYLQARAQRLQDTVALFVGLGGGWWNTEAQVKDAPHDSRDSAPVKPEIR